MSKTVIITLVAFGGFVLVAVLLPKTPLEAPVQTQEQVEDVLEIPSYASGVFPIYPGGVLKNIRESEGESSKDVSISISVEATKADIQKWYRQELKSNGWSITSDKNVAGYQIIQGENKNLYTSLQTASGAEEGEIVISQHLKIRE